MRPGKIMTSRYAAMMLTQCNKGCKEGQCAALPALLHQLCPWQQQHCSCSRVLSSHLTPVQAAGLPTVTQQAGSNSLALGVVQARSPEVQHL